MEEFDFTIWMVEWKRVRGTRAFEMKIKGNGAIIAHGIQKLVCLDVNTQRLVTPPEELLKNFRLDNPREIPSQFFPKIPPVPETAFIFQQKVAWQDVDMLGMVNNAVYVSYAEEAVAQAFSAYGWPTSELKANGLVMAIKRVHIQYKKPAVWNDALDLTTFLLKLNETSGSFCVSMTHASDGAVIANCIVDWEMTDKDSMEKRSLPDSLKKRFAIG